MRVLPNLENCRILVLGDVMLDRYWSGMTQRISPEAPVPVVHVQKTEERIGGAANVANNLAALAVDTQLIGLIGNDEAGETLQKIAAAKGIDTDFIVVKDCPTICKLRILSRHQQLIRMDIESQFTAHWQDDLLEIFKRRVKEVDAVILSDYGKGTLFDPQPFIQFARQLGKKIIVDPKQSNMAVYAGATIVTPNYQEFLKMVGPVTTEQEIIDKARTLILKHELEAILITRGEQGMSLVSAAQVEHLAACGGEVYDVTGAGDTVISTLTAFYSVGLSLNEAMNIANRAAAIVVGKVGTSAVTINELHGVLRHARDIPLGVVNVEALQWLVQDAKAHGEKIVFVNGCYDVLHHGHLRYLERAKQLGDRLIVGVNSDASIKRAKGPNRPVNTLSERMELLAGLKPVDWVVDFDEDTPGPLIQKLLPDVLVKVKEKFTTIQNIPKEEGAHFIIENGGEVHFFDRTPNCSSSDIIAQCRDTSGVEHEIQ